MKCACFWSRVGCDLTWRARRGSSIERTVYTGIEAKSFLRGRSGISRLIRRGKTPGNKLRLQIAKSSQTSGKIVS